MQAAILYAVSGGKSWNLQDFFIEMSIKWFRGKHCGNYLNNKPKEFSSARVMNEFYELMKVECRQLIKKGRFLGLPSAAGTGTRTESNR